MDSSLGCSLSEESRFKKNIEVSPIGNFSIALRPCLQNLLRVLRQLIASKRDDERKPTFHYVGTYVKFQYHTEPMLTLHQAYGLLKYCFVALHIKESEAVSVNGTLRGGFIIRVGMLLASAMH